VIDVFGGEIYRTTYANGDEIGFLPILFRGEIVGGELRPDQVETQAVGWFTRAEAEALEMHPAAREMLRAS
jgi:hypothetical protein